MLGSCGKHLCHLVTNEKDLLIIKPSLYDRRFFIVYRAQLGFKQAALYLTGQLRLLPAVALGKIPRIIEEIMAMAGSFVLPTRRPRHYPRAVKKKPKRYTFRHD